MKVYIYPTWRARRRGLFRNSWLAPSRALREWRALRWLRGNGFDAPRPWGVAEERGPLGDLRRAVLVTAGWPAPSLEQLLQANPELAHDPALLRTLDEWVEHLHRAGFRDRNLDPRNILARPDPSRRWQFAKIDSPRFRLRRPHPQPVDRLAREDRERLAAGIRLLTEPRDR